VAARQPRRLTGTAGFKGDVSNSCTSCTPSTPAELRAKIEALPLDPKLSQNTSNLVLAYAILVALIVEQVSGNPTGLRAA